MSQGEIAHEKELQNLTLVTAGKIGEGVQKTESFFSSACIYRVPESLRKLNTSAYTPKLIAIGPLHRDDKHLQTPLQHVKMSYTDDLLSRVTAGREDPEAVEPKKFKLLKKCLAEMRALIKDAKKCYAEEVTADEEMMLVDGCFIIEYLFRSSDGAPKNGRKTADPICGNRVIAGSRVDVDYDLLLLENQIPFFVLEKLFQLTIARIPNCPHEKNWLLTDYVTWCYRRYIISPPKGSSNNSGSAKTWCSPRDCYHILHVIHDAYMLPSDNIKGEELAQSSETVVLMPSASELVYAGVKFVPGAAKNLLKVKFTKPEGLFWWFHSAHFEIPQLEVYDQTESILRNLVALERCCPDVSQHVSSYVGLMDDLVNSDKDIQVLEQAGVIKNRLGARKDATDLFNNLTKEIHVRYEFGEACREATRYSESFQPRNMAHLRRTYFSSPWTFIAFCVGFIAFVINFVQFVLDFLRKKG